MRIAIWCLTCILAVGALGHAERGAVQAGSTSEAAASIERFLSTPAIPLTSYRALRTLEAATRGGRMHARLDACTSVDPVAGFQYSVIAEDGSDVIRGKVLHAALEAERSMRAKNEVGKGALTPANYDFAPMNVEDDGLVRIAIHPKRRDTLLVEGSLLLTADEGDLVRMEGLLSKRPSLWTRRVEVVHRYARIGGVRVPIRLESTAQVLFVGTSTFSMTYEYVSVNGSVVEGAVSETRCREELLARGGAAL